MKNRLGGTGALSYQEQKKYWIAKAYEWVENNDSLTKEQRDWKAREILYHSGLYGFRSLCKELGILQYVRTKAEPIKISSMFTEKNIEKKLKKNARSRKKIKKTIDNYGRQIRVRVVNQTKNPSKMEGKEVKMKYLTERTQIAQFFNTKPVIKIDMEKPIEGYETIFKGEQVKVMTPSTYHPDLFVVGTMTYSAESKKFYVSSAGSMLKASFGYDDVMELLTWNHAPVVSKDMEVGILEDYPSQKKCRIRVMKVKWVNSQCFEVCTFEDIE